MEEKIEFCEHVYKDMGAFICPLCGKDTHEVDWDLYMEQRREHREKYGWFHNVGVWWSI